MALLASLRRFAQEGSISAAPLLRAVHTVTSFGAAKSAGQSLAGDVRPVLSGIVSSSGPLSAAW